VPVDKDTRSRYNLLVATKCNIKAAKGKIWGNKMNDFDCYYCDWHYTSICPKSGKRCTNSRLKINNVKSRIIDCPNIRCKDCEYRETPICTAKEIMGRNMASVKPAKKVAVEDCVKETTRYDFSSIIAEFTAKISADKK
jgi:hypothetical protein